VKKYKKCLLGLLVAFAMLLFSGCCISSNSVYYDKNIAAKSDVGVLETFCDYYIYTKNKDTGDDCGKKYETTGCENDFRWGGINGMTLIMLAGNHDEMDFDYISDSPALDSYRNKKVQAAVIDILFYTHGHEVDFDNIAVAVDDEVSLAWFKNIFPQNNQAWTVIDEIQYMRRSNDGQWILHSFLADFMVGYSTQVTEGYLYVAAPFWQQCLISGEVSGYRIYYFVFTEGNEDYKLVGLAIGA